MQPPKGLVIELLATLGGATALAFAVVALLFGVGLEPTMALACMMALLACLWALGWVWLHGRGICSAKASVRLAVGGVLLLGCTGVALERWGVVRRAQPAEPNR